jgi:hypothetical protein
MIHGGFYMDEGSVNTVVTNAATFYPVTSGMTIYPQFSVGALVFQNNSEIKVIKPGLYFISIDVSIVEPCHSGQWLGIALMKGGVAQTGGKMYNYNANSAKCDYIGTTYIIALASNDVVKLGVTNKSGPGHNVTVEQVSFLMTCIDR